MKNLRSSNIVISIILLLSLTVMPGFGSGSPVAEASGGATAVSGPIFENTTWTPAGGLYVVTGNVMVGSGATLTIEPGVTVKFNSGLAMDIQGCLVARGTAANPIIFTSNQSTPAPGDWGYIFFSDLSIDATYDISGNYTGGSILEYCMVEYGGGVTGNTGMLRMNNSHPFINYCMVRNSLKRGIYASGLTGNLKIMNSTITGNKGGIFANNPSNITTITNNIISENISGDGAGIYTDAAIISGNIIKNNTATSWGGGINATGAINTITQNTIINNTASGGGGISYGWATVSNNIITGNSATNVGGGIYSVGGIISGNIIAGNSASNAGGGLHSDSGSIITGNSIIRNSSANAPAADFWGGDPRDFKFNVITQNSATGTAPNSTIYSSYRPLMNNNNIFSNNTTNEFYNNNNYGSPNVNATNNWWGTSSGTEIQTKIYDWFDDASKGVVDYTGYLAAPDTTAPPSPPAGFTATYTAPAINLNWNANPEPDIAGYKIYYGASSGFPYNGTGAIEGNSPITAGNVTYSALTGLASRGNTWYIAIAALDSTGNESWYSEEKSVSLGGSISGHVFQADGTTPIEGAKVGVFEYGVRRPAEFGWATTDTSGFYQVGGLNAGQYSVAAGASGYATEWYNDVYLMSQVLPVEVTFPNNTQNINFALETGGVITGHVYQTDGTTPISGADVVVYDAIPLAGRWYTRHVVKTDANGSYTTGGLPTGQYKLWVNAEGYATEWYGGTYDVQGSANISVTAPADVSGINISLDPGGTMSGYVYAAGVTTTPVSGARIDIFKFESLSGTWLTYGSALSGVDGSYKSDGLPPGQYGARCTATSLATEWYNNNYNTSNADPVNIAVSIDTPNVNFTLEPGGTVTGRVFQADGTTPMSGVQVDAYLHSSLSGTWISRGGATTGSDGTYRITGLPVSYYGVRARLAGYANEWYNNTPYKDLAASVNVSATPNINFTLTPGGAISGNVFQSDGTTPIVNCQVTAYDAANWRWVNNIRTDNAGHYVIPALPAGNYYVWANAPAGFSSEYYDSVYYRTEATQVAVSAPLETQNINFNLEPGGTIAGTITSQFIGLPIVNASVDSSRLDGPGGQGSNTDANGNYIITGLPFGQYRVNAPSTSRHLTGDYNYIREYYNNRPDSTTIDPVTISPATPGATGINFALEIGGSISGFVYEADGTTPIPGASVGVNKFNTNLRIVNVTTGADGSYTAYGLAEGQYRVEAWATNHVRRYWQNVLLSQNATAVAVAPEVNTPGINFSLEAGGTVSGTVRAQDNNAPLANVSVTAFRTDGEGVQGATTDTAGNYKVTGLPFGQYRVYSPNGLRNAPADDNLVREYYNGKATQENADIISISDGAPDTTGITFTLDWGGSISGRVYWVDGITPFTGVRVYADKLDGTYGLNVTSGTDGSYSINGLIPGSYKVRVEATGYITEYYNGVYSPGSATAVIVSAPGDTANINFTMETAIALTAPSGLTKISTDNNPLPAFKWNAVSGAATYEVQVDTASWINTGSRAVYIQQAFLGAGAHIIRIKAKDAAGNPGPEAVMSFQVSVAPALANTKIAFVSRSVRPQDLSLFVMNSDGSNRTRLTNSTNSDMFPRWSPDGSKLVFVNNDSGVWDLFTINGSGSGLTKLVSGVETSASWSPNGAKIAFSKNGELYIINSDGSGQEMVLTGSWNGHPEWSPDASELAFVSVRDNPEGDIYILNLGDGSVRRLTSMFKAGWPVWSPDSNHIAFNALQQAGEDWDIWLIWANGSGLARLAESSVTIDQFPTWSPDSNRIAFFSNRDGTSEIFLTNPAQQLTNDDFGYEQPSWSPFLPAIAGGSISGQVLDELGQPIENASVDAVDYETNTQKFHVNTNALGNYQLTGLPAGNYRVAAWAQGKVRRFWQNVLSHGNATPVAVTASSDTQNVNFNLEPGGTISGTVTAQATGLPLANVSVDVGCVDGEGGGGATTDADGNYTINGLPFGQYRVNSPSMGRHESGDDSYATEYYNNKTGWSNADTVTLNAATPGATGVNFSLEVGGSITGFIFQADGITPVPNASVMAINLEINEKYGGVNTGTDGSYTLSGLPAGRVKVFAWAAHYVAVFWQNTLDMNQADTVTVTPPGNVSGININLILGGTISGRVTSQTTGLPLVNVSVNAGRTDGPGGGGAITDINGDYTITGLPFGQYVVSSPSTKRWGSGDNGFYTKYYDNQTNGVAATPVPVSEGLPDASGVNFSLEQGGTISGRMTDISTGNVVNDAGTGSINLTEGWHKFVYRMDEGYGAQGSRAAFKAPGDTDWRWFSTSERPIKTSLAGEEAGILLTTKKNTWTRHPVSHFEMITCVDQQSTSETGWYGQSVVQAVHQDENIHGNDDNYTSLYEAYFYVDTPGIWQFSTSSDDASDIEIDDQFVAYAYVFSWLSDRWEHRSGVGIWNYDTGEWVTGTVVQPDGTFSFNALVPGRYRVGAGASGYAIQYYQGQQNVNLATPVILQPASTIPIDFALEPAGSISGFVFRVLEGDINLPISNAAVVIARADNMAASWYTTTDAFGHFQMPMLPSGNYYVAAWAESYAVQWHHLAYNIQQAAQVAVTAPNDTSGIEFFLAHGGTVSGHVYKSDGTTAIGGARVWIYDTAGRFYLATQSATDGNYNTPPLLPGNYIFKAEAPGYVSEWYNNVATQELATAVPVAEGGDTSDVNFTLDESAAKITFVSDRDGNLEIYKMNIDGTEQTRLTDNPAYDNMSALSPDKTKIAFTSNRDGNREIYVMNADGSGQTRVTNDGAQDYWPTWSPDNNRIAFVSHRDNGNMEIYTANIDGTGLANLTNSPGADRFPAWSPDGTKIAFSSNRNVTNNTMEIYVMNSNGTNPVRLTDNLYTDRFASWSSDSTKIAFTSDRDGNEEIYVINVDGSGTTRLTNNTFPDFQPVWLDVPDKILFTSGRDGNPELYIMNNDGTGQSRLTTNGVGDWSKGRWQGPAAATAGYSSLTATGVTLNGNLTSLGSAESVNVRFEWGLTTAYGNTTPGQVMNAAGVFSTNLTGLAPNATYHFRARADGDGGGWGNDMTFTTTMTGQGKIAFETNRHGSKEIYVMNSDGTNQTRLTYNAARDDHPALSPDGTKVAFVSERDGNNEIYVMNADGTNQTRLTDNPTDYEFPAWSPDGTKIAFNSFDNGQSEIYVMNADGTNQIRLANSLYDRHPAWSPDGSRIAFSLWPNGIYIMNTDGSNPIRLTTYSSDQSPAWSPDGMKIAFNSTRDGSWQTYVMNADGSNQTRLTFNLTNAEYPAWSPDGAKISFGSQYNGNLHIYVMNTDGTNLIRLTSTGDNAAPSWAAGYVPPPVSLVAIGVSNPTVVMGAPQQLNAKGVYSNGARADLTASVSWSSLNPSIATVNTTGLLTPVAAGTVTITATYGGVTGRAEITVKAATLQSIAITPANPVVPAGAFRQMTAAGTYTDASTADVTNLAVWSSSDPSKATIDEPGGLVRAFAEGTTTVTATVSGLTASTFVNVIPPVPLDVTIGEIKQNAARMEGQLVKISGVYRGWGPGFGLPPVGRTDWVAQDDTGFIYVTGSSLGLVYPADAGKPVVVNGLVRVKAGVPYIQIGKVPVPLPSTAINLKFSTAWPPTQPDYTGIYQQVINEIQDRSGGRLKFTAFPGGVLGNQFEQYDVAKNGLADMAVSLMTGQSSRFPMSDVLTLPGTFACTNAGQDAAQAVGQRILVRETGDTTVNSFFQSEPYYMYTRTKQINTLEDIAGLKFRVSGSLQANYITAMDGVPVMIAVSDIYQALQKGVIDGVLATPAMVNNFKLYEVLKYCTKFNFGYGVLVYNFNNASWGRLTPELQGIVNTATRKAGYYEVQLYATDDTAVTQALVNNSGATTVLSAIEEARWIDAIRPVVSQWVTGLEAQGKPAQELLQIAREECQNRGLPFPY